MEHPLISDTEQLTVDELSQRVTDLTKKLQIAQNSGNGHLCHQIRMALDTYRNKYLERVQQSYAQQIKDSGLDNKIQIQ